MAILCGQAPRIDCIPCICRHGDLPGGVRNSAFYRHSEYCMHGIVVNLKNPGDVDVVWTGLAITAGRAWNGIQTAVGFPNFIDDCQLRRIERPDAGTVCRDDIIFDLLHRGHAA